MTHAQFDRNRLAIKSLRDRKNRLEIERDCVMPGAAPAPVSAAARAVIDEAAGRIRAARTAGRPVVLAFGAHTVKNGLAPVLIHMMEKGWITHLATNGAGVIHDWEFAFQGASSEDVKANTARGQFGLWQETGFNINLAINVGAWRGLGYGESVGALIENDGLEIPGEDELLAAIRADPANAAAADLLAVVRRFRLPPGFLSVPHPFKRFSFQAAAYRTGIPATAHPMFGHDIIYDHPMNCGAAIGRTAERDFLAFAESIRGIDGGVYLSVGSAVMSPMVFEKAFAMAQNMSLQAGRPIVNHFIAVVDLAESAWDWRQAGEPPQDHPAYYLRFCKTFSRMGGEMRYAAVNNRDFLLALLRGIERGASA